MTASHTAAATLLSLLFAFVSVPAAQAPASAPAPLREASIAGAMVRSTAAGGNAHRFRASAGHDESGREREFSATRPREAR